MNRPLHLLRKGGGELSGILFTLVLFLSGLFVLLTPLPLIFQLYKKGPQAFLKTALPSLAILFLLYFFGLSPLYSFYQNHPSFSWLLPIPGMQLLEFATPKVVTLFGLCYYLFFVVVSWIVWLTLIHRRVSYYIGTGALILFVIGLVIFGSYSLSRGLSPASILSDYYTTALKEFVSLQANAELPSDRLEFFQDNIPRFASYLTLFSPSFFLCFMIFVLVLNLVVSQRLFGSLILSPNPFKLNQWTLDFFWVWIIIGSLAALLLNTYFFNHPEVFGISANILIVLAFVYFLKGLSILSYFMENRHIGPLGRVMIYGLILIFFHILSFVLAGIGFFDSWVDFRKRWVRSEGSSN